MVNGWCVARFTVVYSGEVPVLLFFEAIKITPRLVWARRFERGLMLAEGLSDVCPQFTLAWNDMLAIVEPALCKP